MVEGVDWPAVGMVRRDQTRLSAAARSGCDLDTLVDRRIIDDDHLDADTLLGQGAAHGTRKKPGIVVIGDDDGHGGSPPAEPRGRGATRRARLVRRDGAIRTGLIS